MTDRTEPCPECQHRHGCKKAKRCRHDPCRCFGVCERCREDIRAAYWRCVRQGELFHMEQSA